MDTSEYRQMQNEVLIEIKKITDCHNKKFNANSAVMELLEYNIIQEHKGLKKFLDYPDLEPKNRLYKQARYNILTYIINCVKADPQNGDHYDEDNKKILREAGELLYKEGGMKSMHCPLVWSFIPKRYGGDINLEWDGIGEWRA